MQVPGSVERYAAALTQVEQSLHLVAISSNIIKYLAAKRDYETIQQVKVRD